MVFSCTQYFLRGIQFAALYDASRGPGALFKIAQDHSRPSAAPISVCEIGWKSGSMVSHVPYPSRSSQSEGGPYEAWFFF
jgi:hypothetical protein